MGRRLEEPWRRRTRDRATRRRRWRTVVRTVQRAGWTMLALFAGGIVLAIALGGR